ncbi:PAS domain-containing protein [Cohnella faecalis]|uniref:histidine kinase n=2 Tax=Cohnella faecalis TaxID=2315694 RepID=A0A398CH33_9BACL|nr:PAS domain-containing protein [Cohnella faecalis]
MSILLIFATALMLFISYLSYQKRHLPVARTVIFIMLAAAFYSLGYAIEILSVSLRGVKLALHIEYLGIPFVTVLWLVLVLQFTNIAAKYRRRLMLLLFAIPVATFFLHLTNDWHHFVYKEYVLNPDGVLPRYNTVKGFWYHVNGYYNYFVIAAGMVLFIPMYSRALPIVRKQILIIALGAVAPFAFNLIYQFARTSIDLTPFGFAVSGFACVWGILRINLLRLTPLALAKVFDTIRDGVVLLDYEDQIVSFNRAAEEVFPELAATKRYPAPGKRVLSNCPELLERIAAANGLDERFPFQRSGMNRHRHYICSLSFIYDIGMDPIGKIVMFNEITELMENEARLRENARQLSRLNAFKDKLFTVMAHDIRDPIALLVSLTELLGEEPSETDIEHAEVFQEIRRQVRNTYHLVDNLLDWYRSQNGKVAFRPLEWNLQQVVRQALSLAGARAGMKQILMTENIDDALTVSADKEMLDLILRNLLSNAIKFTGVGGRIEFGAVVEGDLVKVSVSDNGMGIDEETSELLRQEELFFKEPGSANERGEMRFGLLLTREFLRIHGGSLRFDSVPGEGTTFLFTLPGSANRGETAESYQTAVRKL